MSPSAAQTLAAPEDGARRDLRLGGRWSALQAVKNHAIWAAVRLGLAAARPLRSATLRGFGRALGALVGWLVARVAARNVGVALPHLPFAERAALARRALANLGGHLGELVAVLGGAPVAALDVDDEAVRVLEEARAEGRGVLFASAHLGPWERVAAALVRRGVPLVALARESYDPRLTRVYDALRARLGVRAIYRGSPGAAVRIVRVLRGGDVLGVPMDLRTRAPSARVPFLGADAPTVIGPARIALRTGAAVVVGTVARVDGRLVVTATRVSTEGLEGDPVCALTRRMNDELSRRILALPDEWPWVHDRWGRDP